MKTAIHLPTPEDFHHTDAIDLSNLDRHNLPPKESEMISYKKTKVNMMNIVDLMEYEATVQYMKDADFDEYQKQMQEWQSKHGNRMYVGEGGMHPMLGNINHQQNPPPEPKLQTKKITGTIVTYHNTSIRIIADDFNEFWEKYSDWLRVKKLDFSE